MSNSNQFPSIPPISTTTTTLLECSRSNSIIDRSNKVQGGEENASWINSTSNFQIKKGDQISIEMIALNLAQTTTPMEFTGENVILEGAETKEYVDNKVILEIGYYINNNQSYSNNLPFTLAQGINDQVDLPALASTATPSGAVNRQNIFPKADLVGTTTDRGIYPGFGMGFGYKYNDSQALGALNESAFQYPTIDAGAYLNSYRIVGFTGEDYITMIPIVAGVALPPTTNAWSVILEHSAGAPLTPSITPATPTSFCSYDTFKNWTLIGTDEGMFGSVGMRMRFELGIGAVGLSQFEVVDIRSGERLAAPYNDVLRVQVCFPRPVAGTLNTGGIKEGGFPIPIEQGAAVCFCTPEIRYNDIFRGQGQASWNNTQTAPVTRYSQKRQNSGFTDFFSQGLVGSHLVANFSPPLLSANQPINLAYPETAKRITPPVNPAVPTPSENWFGMTFLSGGGIGSANRLQGTDNLPYIITRNDFMGTCSKANCEQLGRYETFCPEMRPLTSFIELEATDLLMDATSLASVINEKLHASLPSMGENANDIRQYQTNVYGFTKRYKKSSQLLPYNTFSGFFPLHSYPREDGAGGGYLALSYPNTEKWNRIDDYFSGGCKQIIPANFQPGWNKINYIGYNANTTLDTLIYGVGGDAGREYGDTYPSFESTYLRTCKRPPDWFGDACSWNNMIDGNKGVKDIFKQMWGDSFNRIPVWDGNSREVAGGTHKGATSRNFNMPVILNTQLQNQYLPAGKFVEPTIPPATAYFGEQNFPTTILVKDQMIFTNMYYNKEGIQSTEQPPEPNPITFENGYEWFDKVRQKLVEKQRDYEIYINASNKTANTNDKQIQDITGWAIELDLGMTNDYLTNKWVAGYGGDLDSRSIEYTWATTPPPAALALPFPSASALQPLDVNSLTPSTTSAWFGSGYINNTHVLPAPVATASLKFDWNRNQAVNRSVGKLWIQSKYDSNWLISSNTGGEIEPYPDSLYPQIPQSTALNDTACSIKQPDGSAWADDTWSRENDMGFYPYEYTDVDGGKHIFTAFRVAQTYKAATSQQVNSQITNTWRLGQIKWGMRFGFSPSAYDNFAITPMNPDDKVLETTETKQWVNIPPITENSFVNIIQRGLIENCNSYVAIGADNPTFTYDPTKSRMELTQTYQTTLLSPFNSSSKAGKSVGTDSPPPDLPELGQPVALFNDICPDAVYSPPAAPVVINTDVTARALNPTGGGVERTQNQRSEETGIFIYKIWLPNENWVAPTDINLYSYWSNNTPEGQKFASPLPGQGYNGEPNFALYDDGINVYRNRDNQDNTENNREEIIAGCVEASDENWRGCLLSKLGFTKEQLLPLQGRQFNRYSVNGYNNPQPDLIVTQNTKPLILNNQSNITLNTAFNLYYTPTTPVPVDDLVEEFPPVEAYTVTTPQPDLVTPQPDLVTPQPDLETVVPAVPAINTLYNYDTEGLFTRLETTDVVQTNGQPDRMYILPDEAGENYINFRDDGGLSGNYTNNNNRSVIFDAGAGNHIYVRINNLQIEASASQLYDRLGITASDAFSGLSVATGNLNTTTAPVLSPLMMTSATAAPYPNCWSVSLGSSSAGGWIFPLNSSTFNGSTWYKIATRYMRVWFHSDSSVVQSGWDIDIAYEKRIPAIPSYIIYTPQPDLITPQPDLITPQPDLVENFPFVPGYTTTTPQPDLMVAAPTSGLPIYGLGFSNDLPVVVNSTNSFLTAVNPVESTNSPFFQIYSTICPNNYLDNGTKKAIMFYCMKNYQSGNYSYGYGSTFAHTATKSYNLDQIHTEIRNPITGRLMRVLQPNSVITYKITRPIILAPDPYDPETGEPIDPLTTEPIAQDLAFDTDELFNLVPPQQGGAVGDAGFGNIPPAEQEQSYFFNGNNQVVNLQSDEAVALQAQSLQNQFNPINSYIPNPNDETKSQSFISPAENVVIVAPYNQEIVEEGVIQGIVLEQETKEGEGKQKDAERGRTRDRNDRRNARRREQRANESEESGSERRARRTAKDRERREERRNPESSTPTKGGKGADVESMPPPPPRPPRGAGGGGEGGGESKEDKK